MYYKYSALLDKIIKLSWVVFYRFDNLKKIFCKIKAKYWFYLSFM
jgi:hypothetical protein